MAGRLKPKTDCTGGENCPLGLVEHPKASGDAKKSRFALGCSLCRSEHLGKIAENADASTGVNLERRGSMIQRFGGVRGHEIDREMKVIRKGDKKAAAKGEDGEDAAAKGAPEE